MKFIHMADCHIGSWREPNLRNTSTEAFKQVCQEGIHERIDFFVIAGDLFNTSSPGIDYIKEATKALKAVADAGISVYVIPGSHDFSPSGKTMIDVLERAGLVVNVARATTDNDKLSLTFTKHKTGVKLCGILGKKGMLDAHYYDVLNLKKLEDEPGEKIFLFHTMLTEFKPHELELMESVPLSTLPKGFKYYAGGHPHFAIQKDIPDYGTIAYPGPLFPNNFRELEKLNHGGYYLVEDWKATWKPVKLHDCLSLTLDATGKSAHETQKELLHILPKQLVNTIVTLRVHGKLKEGRPYDIQWNELAHKVQQHGGVCMLRNTAKLFAKNFTKITTHYTNETDLINEHLSELPGATTDYIQSFMNVLNQQQKEGERKLDYEERIIKDAETFMHSKSSEMLGIKDRKKHTTPRASHTPTQNSL